MTARPNTLERRRLPVCAAVALVMVMVVTLLATGCIGGDVTREQDLAVIKLDQNGLMAWMKTIDSGKDDEVTDVIQTYDGGYALSGGHSTPSCNRASHFPTTPTIIHLSDKGDILWEREYSSELMDRYENSIKKIIQSSDDAFFIISQQGMVLKISSSGFPQGQLNNTNVSSYVGEEKIKTKSLIFENFTKDEAPPFHNSTISISNNSLLNVNINGSYFPPFTTILQAKKLDSNGTLVWNSQVTSFTTDMSLIHIRKMIETEDGGYLLVLGIEKQKSCHRDSLSDFIEFFWKMIIESRIQRS